VSWVPAQLLTGYDGGKCKFRILLACLGAFIPKTSCSYSKCLTPKKVYCTNWKLVLMKHISVIEKRLGPCTFAQLPNYASHTAL
jgi:hypothetical protein